MTPQNHTEGTQNEAEAGARGLRHLFRKRADGYAGADLRVMKRVAGGLWILGALCVIALLPVSPVTKAIGTDGRFVAIGLLVVALGCAGRIRLAPDRVGVNELLAMSYASLVSVSLLEWLAGGDNTPYNHMYLLPVVYTAMVHPPRRTAPFLLFFAAAAGLRFSYADWDPQEVGDVALQVFTYAGLAFLGCVVMDGVRAQRLSLREEGDAARELAATDSLTGLGNRRSLIEDLARRAEGASASQPLVLTLFDLDGFKAYNDAYGHPAGDTVLARLGQRLHEAAAKVGGAAYRMGGDEFCVLASPGPGAGHVVARACVEALTEAGDGFFISASHGTVVIPDEYPDPEPALRAADQRMYANKSERALNTAPNPETPTRV
jgi:diguanylate cyclase (GGDEF)-like protein